jgi:hypothetical protein
MHISEIVCFLFIILQIINELPVPVHPDLPIVILSNLHEVPCLSVSTD